jgi:hypothetical protein
VDLSIFEPDSFLLDVEEAAFPSLSSSLTPFSVLSVAFALSSYVVVEESSDLKDPELWRFSLGTLAPAGLSEEEAFGDDDETGRAGSDSGAGNAVLVIVMSGLKASELPSYAFPAWDAILGSAIYS